MNQALAPIKPSTSDTIGRLLQSARLQRGLSLEEIAQRTFIKQHYLQALEDERFERLPAPVYTSGYIRQVARMLGLDDISLIQKYHQNRQQQTGEGPASPESSSPMFLPVLSQRDGRSRVETLRLSTEQAQSGETSSVMETVSAPVAPAAPKQVIETIEGARKEALSMRYQTEQFADQVLLHLEEEIQKTLSIVQNGRAYLQKRLNSY